MPSMKNLFRVGVGSNAYVSPQSPDEYTHELEHSRNFTSTHPFLSLPLELQNRIYAYILTIDEPIDAENAQVVYQSRFSRENERAKRSGHAPKNGLCCDSDTVETQSIKFPMNRRTFVIAQKPSLWPWIAIFVSLLLELPKL